MYICSSAHADVAGLSFTTSLESRLVYGDSQEPPFVGELSVGRCA